MSRFIRVDLDAVKEYVPGEQPKDMRYVKLNTNESPFPPSPKVTEAVAEAAKTLNLYSDPELTALTAMTAKTYGVDAECLLMTNGSDEILNFAFCAFGSKNAPFVFPSLTYGFYPVFAELYGIPYKKIPLKNDFSIDINDYENVGANIAIANPNAPTGKILSVKDIETILCSNREHVVVIDEAYIDFGGESCMKLITKYDNLLVTRTFSKSFSLAGARLGFGAGDRELIKDLKKIKYSTNPYNVNSVTDAAGRAALEDYEYYMNNCSVIAKNRDFCAEELKKRGFFVTDSKANFLFASHLKLSGREYYLKLKERGVLVRYFGSAGAENFVRITVGTEEQMNTLLYETDKILSGE